MICSSASIFSDPLNIVGLYHYFAELVIHFTGPVKIWLDQLILRSTGPAGPVGNFP